MELQVRLRLVVLFRVTLLQAKLFRVRLFRAALFRVTLWNQWRCSQELPCQMTPKPSRSRQGQKVSQPTLP